MNFIRSGLRAIRDNPALAFAEIAWRWTFGAAVYLVLFLTVRAIMAGIDVSSVEIEFAHHSDAVRIADAAARILVQVLPRFVHALAVTVPLLALVWIAAATLGRLATLRALRAPARSAGFQPAVAPASSRLYFSVAAIHALRALFSIAAFIAFFGTIFAISAQTSPDTVSDTLALLVFGWMLFGLLVGMLWSVVNWFLALAPIFVVRDGSSIGRAIAASLAFYRSRSREYLAIASWYGLFRGAALAVAILAGFVVVAAGSVRAGIALSIIVALGYFAIADFLYIARLASYVALANTPVPAIAASAGVTSAVPDLPTPYTETEPET